jgi:uncharacterized RDD family membrane protein YckC
MVRASFGKRFLAALLDGIIVGVVGSIFLKIAGAQAGQAISTAIGLAYYIYFEGGQGATPGKKALGLKVISTSGTTPIGYGSAAVRYVGRLVSAIPLLLGYFWMLWDKDKQTWHDKMASTYVVEA